MESFYRSQKGVVLVEALISIAILVTLITGSISIIMPGIKSAQIGRQRLQAKWLLTEEEEAIRQVRNESWSNLSAGTYYPIYNPTSNPPTTYQGWQLVPGVFVKNGFNEYLVISIPLRVNSNQLSDTSGAPDNSMRKIVYTVSWNSFGTTYTMTLTNYLSNWQPF